MSFNRDKDNILATAEEVKKRMNSRKRKNQDLAPEKIEEKKIKAKEARRKAQEKRKAFLEDLAKTNKEKHDEIRRQDVAIARDRNRKRREKARIVTKLDNAKTQGNQEEILKLETSLAELKARPRKKGRKIVPRANKYNNQIIKLPKVAQRDTGYFSCFEIKPSDQTFFKQQTPSIQDNIAITEIPIVNDRVFRMPTRENAPASPIKIRSVNEIEEAQLLLFFANNPKVAQQTNRMSINNLVINETETDEDVKDNFKHFTWNK